MDNMYVDYKLSTRLGKKFQDEASDLKKILCDIDKIQSQLKVVGKLEDDKYIQKINCGKKIMMILSDAVQETGDFLVNVSEAHEKVLNSQH